MNLQLVAMQKISSTWFIHESQFFIRRKAMQELLNYDTPHGHNYQYRDVGPCILKDDFSKLDRPRLMIFFRVCQKEDGRFISRMIHLRVPSTLPIV